MKSLPYPFRSESPRIGHYREFPPPPPPGYFAWFSKCFFLMIVDQGTNRPEAWYKPTEIGYESSKFACEHWSRLSLLSAEKKSLRTRALLFSRWPIRLHDRMKFEWSTQQTATELACEQALLGVVGGRGKEERACNDVSGVFISASKKSTQNADWWILNLVLTSLLFACVVLTMQTWWKAEFLFVKVARISRNNLGFLWN